MADVYQEQAQFFAADAEWCRGKCPSGGCGLQNILG